MKINVGIVGYGNLGKAVEKIVLSSKKFNLVAIFSRRIVVSKFNTPVENYENFLNYKSKIDVMLLCGSSKTDLESQTTDILKYFDCINTFDTHSKIPFELERFDYIGKNYNHRLIMSCGWDPGSFSVIRAIFKSLGENDPVTFWGKGISLGHSDAIRKVEGVLDAVQITIPNKEAIKLANGGNLTDNISTHFRECYVYTNQKDTTKIENDIKNIPNYFKGQPTTVNFVSKKELEKLKSKPFHKGKIIQYYKFSNGSKFKMNFSVSMDSNPDFTAKIMVSYITALENLIIENKFGAFTALDIPVSYLFSKSDREKLLKLC